jgi:hypothetical protein
MTTLLRPEGNPPVAPLRLAPSPRDAAGAAALRHVRAPARWIAPAFLLGIDGVALLAAVALAGSTPIALAYAGVALGALASSHAYRVRITLRSLDETPWLVGRLASAAVPGVELAAQGDVEAIGGSRRGAARSGARR